VQDGTTGTAGQTGQHRGDSVGELALVIGGVGISDVQEIGQRRTQRAQQGRRRSARGAQQCHRGRPFGGRASEYLLYVRVDSGPQRPQRYNVVVGTLAVQHHPPFGAGQRGDFAYEAALSGTRRTLHQDQPARSVGGAAPTIDQLPNLFVPADQFRLHGGGHVAGTERKRTSLAGGDPVQITKQPLGAVVAIVRILGQQRTDDRRESRRNLWPQVGNVRRSSRQVQVDEFASVRGDERRSAHKALKPHHPEGVQVRPAVDDPMQYASLLRCRVHERADGGVGDIAAGACGQPEVDERCRSVVTDHDVVGLDVSMYHSSPVSHCQGAGDLTKDADRTRRVEPIRVEHLS
jgi:hypothetical protein